MNDLPQKVGRPKNEFIGFAVTQNGAWRQERLRDEWRRLLKAERQVTKEDDEPQVDTVKDASDLVLSTFRSGRIYNSTDIQKRCRMKGYFLSPQAIENAIRSLKRAGKIKDVAERSGGKNKMGSMVTLAETT